VLASVARTWCVLSWWCCARSVVCWQLYNCLPARAAAAEQVLARRTLPAATGHMRAGGGAAGQLRGGARAHRRRQQQPTAAVAHEHGAAGALACFLGCCLLNRRTSDVSSRGIGMARQAACLIASPRCFALHKLCRRLVQISMVVVKERCYHWTGRPVDAALPG
jgi:hypothetical protein